jgi:hypothetical protein
MFSSAQQSPGDLPIPPRRAHHSLAFDAKRGEVILYGGSTAAGDDSSTFFDDLWSWNGRRWNRLATTGLPRSSHRLIYDPKRKRLLLLGGMDDQGQYGEMRFLDGKSWVLLNTSPVLAAVEPSVTYDTRRRRIVLFGGLRADRSASGGTWEFDGSAWKQVATTGPDPRHSAAMVYDEARGVVLLFGGRDDRGPSGQTWQWDGTAWSQVATTGPPARLAAGLGYDVKRKQAVLFGGLGSSGILADTWLWDGNGWQEYETPGPSGRVLPAMAYDGRRSVVVLFGGRIKYPEDSNETWEWDGRRWAHIE